MKFDDWVGEIEAPMTTWQLELLNAERGEVAKANDALRCGNEGLCEGADHGSENGAGENAHVKVQPHCKAAN